MSTPATGTSMSSDKMGTKTAPKKHTHHTSAMSPAGSSSNSTSGSSMSGSSNSMSGSAGH
jgi:hypothetical protein